MSSHRVYKMFMFDLWTEQAITTQLCSFVTDFLCYFFWSWVIITVQSYESLHCEGSGKELKGKEMMKKCIREQLSPITEEYFQGFEFTCVTKEGEWVVYLLSYTTLYRDWEEERSHSYHQSIPRSTTSTSLLSTCSYNSKFFLVSKWCVAGRVYFF